MQPMANTGSQQVSHTASFVREVLTRLTSLKLPPTPENFAWVYRQLQREQNLPATIEYVSDLAILEHAIQAFDQLFVADAWLNAKIGELREMIAVAGVPDAKKRQQVKTTLEEITKRKEQLLFHLAESSLALRSSISDIVKEIGKLSGSVGGFQTDLGKYQTMLENCHDIADARRLLIIVANDTKKLNEALYDHEQAVSKNFSRLQESGATILSNVKPPNVPNAPTSHNATGVAEKPADAASKDAKRSVSPLALPSEALIKRVAEPAYSAAVLLLVELTELNASERQVAGFSELLASRVDKPMLLGYWGGAQFVVVMPNASPAKALLMSRELAGLGQKAAKDAGGPFLFSYGISSYVDNDRDAQAFYKAFELAFSNLRPMKEIAA